MTRNDVLAMIAALNDMDLWKRAEVEASRLGFVYKDFPATRAVAYLMAWELASSTRTIRT